LTWKIGVLETVSTRNRSLEVFAEKLTHLLAELGVGVFAEGVGHVGGWVVVVVGGLVGLVCRLR
jgi:hypothetical protein